jgi:ABC-type polar amino acid transport system ATPase subunit
MIYYLVELLFRWCLNEYIDEKTYTKIDTTCVSKEFVEFTSINGSFKSDIVNCVKKLEDNANDNIHSDKSGIVDSVKKLTDNINAGIHSDKEETIMLIKHIVNLWSDKDSTIKEMLMNWNIK